MDHSSHGSDSTFRPDSTPVHSSGSPTTHPPGFILRQEDAGQRYASSENGPSFEISSPVPYNSRKFQADRSGNLDGLRYQISPSPELPLSPSGVNSSGTKRTQKSSELPVQLLRNPFAAESTYYTRLNRYFGPPSNWRRWTEKDRAIAATVDLEKAENLSRHLFNAFVLKRSAEMAEGGSQTSNLAAVDLHMEERGRKRSRNGKERAIESSTTANNDEDHSKLYFKPPRLWTAWPLPPNEVPRETLLPYMDRSQNPAGDHTSSSTNLQDCLIACMTRFARRRWADRDWESSQEAVSSPLHVRKQSTEPPQAVNEITDVNMHEVLTGNDERNSLSASSAQDPPPKTDGVNNGEWFSSQAFVPSSSSSSSESAEESTPLNQVDKIPVVMADDARARNLLLSSARHIVSRLDDILTTAHVSRQSYSHKRQTSRSRSKSTGRSGEKSISELNRRHESTSTQQNQSYRGRSPQKDINKEALGSPKDSAESRSHSHSHSQPRSHPLEPQDWSTVIGLASITQVFEPQTIARASERCAQLFGENMIFRTFHEGEPRQVDFNDFRLREFAEDEQPNDIGPWFTEDFIIDDETNLNDDIVTSEASEDEIASDANGEDMVNAVYIRTSAVCRQCNISKSRCEVPALPQPSEKATNDLVTPCDRCIRSYQHCSGIRYSVSDAHDHSLASERPPTRAKFCPFRDCERHTIPFPKMSNLKRHITLRHKHEKATGMSLLNSSQKVGDARNRSISSKRSTSSGPPQDEAFYCPVFQCPRNKSNQGKPFQTGSRMYTHVRGKHPEVDIETVKRLELLRRGERRGRWTDERRHRTSRSASRSRSLKVSRNGANVINKDSETQDSGNMLEVHDVEDADDTDAESDYVDDD